jgi:hypothetical protein
VAPEISEYEPGAPVAELCHRILRPETPIAEARLSEELTGEHPITELAVTEPATGVPMQEDGTIMVTL